MRENFTVLVQGPLEQNTIKAIECYSMDYKVVVSTWQEETELHEHVQHLCKLNNNIKFVNEKAPTVIGPPGLAGVLRDTTFHYAITGLQNGLKFVDTEYVISVYTKNSHNYEIEKQLFQIMTRDLKNQ